MKNLEICTYDNPDQVGGWKRAISTEDWILFEHEDGSVHLGRRDPTGAVTGELMVLEK
jgi:hypothetical protein